jgi:hypothetical protein
MPDIMLALREGVKRWRMRVQARLQAAKEGKHVPTAAELAHSHLFQPDSPDSFATAGAVAPQDPPRRLTLQTT